MDKSTEIIKNFQSKSIKYLLWFVGVSVLYCVFLLAILAQISKQVGQLPIWLIVGCEILAWASTTYLYLQFDKWLTGLKNANFNEAMAKIDQAYQLPKLEAKTVILKDYEDLSSMKDPKRSKLMAELRDIYDRRNTNRI